MWASRRLSNGVAFISVVKKTQVSAIELGLRGLEV